jgi:6-phosphofructokinase 2
VTPAIPIATLTLNPALDESTSIPRLEPDRKLRCSPSVFHPGGGGINVARTIVELGGRAVAIFPCGGPAGHRLEELLRAESVETMAVPIGHSIRENLNVRDEGTGSQYRFCKPGPALKREEWRACLEAIESLSSLEYLVLSGSLPPGVPSDLYRRISERAKRRGVRVLLDASGEALEKGAGPDVYLLKTSLSEFETLVGECAPTSERRIELARRLISTGRCAVLVLTLGAGGALWVSSTESGVVPAVDVTVVSVVGAGDSLLGGLVWRLAGGASLREAISFGVVAGGAAVMNPGTELCRRADVERLWTHVGTLARGRAIEAFASPARVESAIS